MDKALKSREDIPPECPSLPSHWRRLAGGRTEIQPGCAAWVSHLMWAILYEKNYDASKILR
jgi:hypothetical protein